MGCGASTTVATDLNNPILQIEKDGDLNLLKETTRDSGDLSVKNPCVFGDQLEDVKNTINDDTNFHNSPLNVETTDIPINSTENETTSERRLSVASSLSHNKEDIKSKRINSATEQNELLSKDIENSSEKNNQSKSSSRQSHVFKPTAGSSDDEESKCSTKKETKQTLNSLSSVHNEECKLNKSPISSKSGKSSLKSKSGKSSLKSKSGRSSVKSKEIFLKSKQDEASVHLNQNDQESLVSKSHDKEENVNTEHEEMKSHPRTASSINSVGNSDNEKYDKVQDSSHTLTCSNKSPFFESINANADVNQSLHDELTNENIDMGTGDINQNHQNNSTIISISDFKDENLSVHDENLYGFKTDILGTGDMCFEKIAPFIDESCKNGFNSEFVAETNHNKDVSSSRASLTSELSRRSSNASSIKHEYLKTAEVHDGDLEESLHGFEMKDRMVDFNEIGNYDNNLPEAINDVTNFENIKDTQEGQCEE